MVTGENVPNTKENLIDNEVSHDYALRPEQELRFEVSFLADSCQNFASKSVFMGPKSKIFVKFFRKNCRKVQKS